MDYGPAPEANGHVLDWLTGTCRRLRPLHQRRASPSRRGKVLRRRQPGHRREARPRRAGHGRGRRCGREGGAQGLSAHGRSCSGHERAKHLYAIARIIQKRERFLAVLETMDNGKPIRESRDIDIPLVARHFYHHAGWAELIADEFPGHEPVGVCGQIIPWNFPLLMLAWKIAPALAAGNTVVLKPAEFTPLTALAFAEICREAGLPPGVVNIVTGDGATGAALVDHPDVDKIAFTGSTEVGRLIRKATAGSGKKLSLELGGKSPFIVLEDADLDAAVEGVVDAIWFNQGQVCCAGSRILVQEGVAPKFLAKLQRRMETLRVGDPLDKSIDMGAIVDPVQLAAHHRARGEGQGRGRHAAAGRLRAARRPATGSRRRSSPMSSRLDRAWTSRSSARSPRVMTFRTPEEAVQLANHTRYGLAAIDLVGEHQPGARYRRARQGRRGVDQLHQPVRCRRGLRRLPRSRASAARAGARACMNIWCPPGKRR